MQRKEFLKRTATTIAILDSLSIRDLFAAPTSFDVTKSNIIELAEVDEIVRKRFVELIEWCRESGWNKYFQERLGLKLEGSDAELTAEISGISEIKENNKGLNDFGGQRL